MKKILYILILLAGTIYATPHLTHNYVSRYYTTRDGLVQMQVMCIYQDRDGYMWFGTKDGVSRFDGVNFKNYTFRDGLPVGQVSSIIGWDDKIVMLSKNRLVILYPDDKFECFDVPYYNDYHGINPGFKELDKNRLLVYNCPTQINSQDAFDGYTHFIFTLKDKRFHRFNFNHQLVQYIDNKYLITPKWIYTIRKGFNLKPYIQIPFEYYDMNIDMKKGLLYFKVVSSTDSRSRIRNICKYHIERNQLVFDNKFTNRFPDSYNPLYLLSDGSLMYFDKNWKAKFFPSRKVDLGFDLTIINALFVDRENNLWIGTDCGVYNFFNLNMEEYKLNLAKSDNIWSVVEDLQHNIWFGSYGSGLWKMDKHEKLSPMKCYPLDEWVYQYMGSIISIINSKGVLYFPTGGGVYKYENNQFVNIGPTGACTAVFFDEKTQKLYYSGFKQKDRRNVEGIFCQYGNKKHFFPIKKGLPRAIKKDKNGRILLGSPKGLSYLIGDSIIVEDTVKRPYTSIISMVVDKKGWIWKGTENGIYIQVNNGKEYRLAGDKITDPVFSIMLYHDKYLLAGGIRGLFIVDIQRLISYSHPEMWEIGYDSGFTGLESGQNGFCEDHNGDVWLTTALYVLKFNPEKLVQSQKQIIPFTRVAAIHYSSDNKAWKTELLTTLDNTKDISLNPQYRFIRYEYVANSISAPKSLRFRYRLLGFTQDWSQPVYVKAADFTNLGYGKYQFEVQSSLDGEHWSPIAISPFLVIERPFYLSYLAIIFYVFVMALTIVVVTTMISRRRHRKKTEILNKQKYESELQLSMLRSKVIPHFTKNVLSAIGNFAMTNRVKASYYISVFSRFTHLTLSNADKNYVTLKDELEYLETYLELEKMRFGQRFEYKIEIDNLVSMDILLPAMILHTYCDNAIRHGLVHKEGNGLLEIIIKLVTNGVLFIISDNGIGRERALELGTTGNGQGLRLLQAQIDFYNQFNSMSIRQTITDLRTGKGKPNGTKIELFVPQGYKFIVE